MEVSGKGDPKMNSYSEDNVCVKCKKSGEVIFHQYVNSFSCQLCGFWWDFGVDVKSLILKNKGE
jgi:ribosomal protein L37E